MSTPHDEQTAADEFVELLDRLAAAPILEAPPCDADAPELLAALLEASLALALPEAPAPASMTSAKAAAVILMSVTEGLLASGLSPMVIVELARTRPGLVSRFDPWMNQVIWPCSGVVH